ncbi:methionine--tRNA ligase [Amycolatopsis sp. H20-H5]|uniref:methionine--tRNA ligase n=1 Tax=Amycolatopsis sp. H20-H5 TaxID=3046309 RepID=UPI002DB7253A|nr:methionine--tRNA ligase [Amycolatopsis sp. H20-H5]MEC3978044.1 methionine--tRNA ligase [Amycolatopsis sp. H20-H5]
MTESVFVSTTIPYVNACPHLGHAFEFVQADVTARHLARQGKEVFFSSGTDENSLKNVQSAEKNGESTADLVRRHAADFAGLMSQLGVVVNRFVRTSVDPDHRTGAADLWQRMADRGDIYSRHYEGLYCVGCEEFRTPAELVGGRCAVHRTEPSTVRERNYFFRLSKYQDAIVGALTGGDLRIWPASRRNEMLGLVRGGLTDISISRSVGRAHGWGIPVPGDDSQVMYVWIDALTNYVNALGWARGSEDYDRYWRDAGRRIHVMGKDVTRFHAVYWPAMLMSAGLPLPTDVVVHGHVLLSGQKLSKSLGNVVDPFELMHRYSTEAVRFLMLAEFSPWADVDFTDQRLVARYNTDLANGLGNLVDRVTGMTQRYRDGVVPEAGRRGPLELSLLHSAVETAGGCRESLDRFDHREAVARIWDLVRAANKYVNLRAPWDLAGAADSGDTDAATVLDAALHDLVATLRTVALLLGPILPGTSAKVLDALGLVVPDTREDGFSALDGWSPGVAQSKVGHPPHLFPRLELTW